MKTAEIRQQINEDYSKNAMNDGMVKKWLNSLMKYVTSLMKAKYALLQNCVASRQRLVTRCCSNLAHHVIWVGTNRSALYTLT